MNRYRKIFLQTLLILLVAALSTSCSAQAKKSRALHRAEEYFKAGDYDKAKIEYTNGRPGRDHYAYAMSILLSGMEQYQLVGAFGDCMKVELDVLRLQPDVILMDIDMPGRTGIEGKNRVRLRGARFG